MDIKVTGGVSLNGEVTPSGNKNAAVAMIPATILFSEPVTLSNIPDIPDVSRLLSILEGLGGKVDWDKENDKLTIDNSGLTPTKITKEQAGNMKGTALLWGPMISRFQKINVHAKSGGCTLGVRPVGPQYQALRDMGVEIEVSDEGTSMDGTKAKAQSVWLIDMSPTITENLVMLAIGLEGTTRIVGAASEPHVQDLCNFLVKAGAKINGIGSSVLEVEGGHALSGVDFQISNDHHEIATFLALGAITEGTIRVNGAMPEHFGQINNNFAKFGLGVRYEGDTAIMNGDHRIIIPDTPEGPPSSIKAQPWPGFPVDILPLFIPVALAAESGEIIFHNWMYEAGLFWTTELIKLGANVMIADPHRVLIRGGRKLTGAKMEAPYIIRAVIAMVMAAMISEGESVILNADVMYRAHPGFVENLRKLGAEISELSV